MRTFVILGLTALAATACQDAAGPRDTASPGRGLTADVVGTSTLSLLDALGAATPATRFSVFGSSGVAILSSLFVGPEFILTQPTTITEIGGFVNNCGTIVAGSPECPGTLPFTVQIRPSRNGIPDAATVLASFALSHDDDPLVISYESVATNLTLGPGSYFALFAPQETDGGFLLANARDPFNYQAGSITLGVLNPTTGTSSCRGQQGRCSHPGRPGQPTGSHPSPDERCWNSVPEGELTQGQGNGLLGRLRATDCERGDRAHERGMQPAWRVCESGPRPCPRRPTPDRSRSGTD